MCLDDPKSNSAKCTDTPTCIYSPSAQSPCHLTTFSPLIGPREMSKVPRQLLRDSEGFDLVANMSCHVVVPCGSQCHQLTSPSLGRSGLGLGLSQVRNGSDRVWVKSTGRVVSCLGWVWIGVMPRGQITAVLPRSDLTHHSQPCQPYAQESASAIACTRELQPPTRDAPCAALSTSDRQFFAQKPMVPSCLQNFNFWSLVLHSQLNKKQSIFQHTFSRKMVQVSKKHTTHNLHINLQSTSTILCSDANEIPRIYCIYHNKQTANLIL